VTCTVRCVHGTYHPGDASDEAGNPLATCSCDLGWGGIGCVRPLCERHGCQKGVCVAPDECTCDVGWTGAGCDNDLIAPQARPLFRAFTPQEHKFSSLIMHKGSSPDVWTELRAWVETLMPDQEHVVNRAQLSSYLPSNDTLLLKRSSPRSNKKQVSIDGTISSFARQAGHG
jgi:hypothetical protein